MGEPSLIEEQSDGVVRLLLNRPGTRNALDEELVGSLGAALTRAAADPATKVIILGGRGGAFCSGVDLKSATRDLNEPERLRARLEGFHHVIRTIASAAQPVIAEVDGAAVGFGADLAFACDLRVGSSRAYFEEKFVGIGLMPDGGGTYQLPRLIGIGKAMEHLLLGSRIDATDALGSGILNRVVPPEALEAEARGIAARLASGPPLAVAAIKRTVRANLSATLDEALAREFAGQLGLLASDDVREGIAAFFERRAPVFRGK